MFSCSLLCCIVQEMDEYIELNTLEMIGYIHHSHVGIVLKIDMWLHTDEIQFLCSFLYILLSFKINILT